MCKSLRLPLQILTAQMMSDPSLSSMVSVFAFSTPLSRVENRFAALKSALDKGVENASLSPWKIRTGLGQKGAGHFYHLYHPRSDERPVFTNATAMNRANPLLSHC